ncbi:MAG: hypothetical protein ING83_10985, partial [Rhodocyclaceae bacterium]|nr:hypothetical protein [Rhodocyclaceae bacterium]
MNPIVAPLSRLSVNPAELLNVTASPKPALIVEFATSVKLPWLFCGREVSNACEGAVAARLPSPPVTAVAAPSATLTAIVPLLLLVGVTGSVYCVGDTAVTVPFVPPLTVTSEASKPVTAAPKVNVYN